MKVRELIIELEYCDSEAEISIAVPSKEEHVYNYYETTGDCVDNADNNFIFLTAGKFEHGPGEGN